MPYGSIPEPPKFRKISSKYDLDNPNRDKLGTFDGVFMPTALNVLSILMFLRFGFIIGQMGVLGTFLLLLLSYGIDLLTTLSISAISTNGTVRGGGAYYMISRCLGPEFGGSIGLIFFLGQILNSGMNAVGLLEPILYNFGANGVMVPILIEGYWWQFAYASVILGFCLVVSLVGPGLVSKAGRFLFFMLLTATISVPLSVLFVKPFDINGVRYTGPNWEVFMENLWPKFTQGAAGSVLPGTETFNDLFGIFFPATAGIFAGAGMSSELRKPSKSIPKGTLWGLLLTFVCYSMVIMALGCAVPREILYKEVTVLQAVNMSQILILIGELSTSLFSIIVGILGAAYVLEAIAKDKIIPGLGIFADNSTTAILFSWFVTQMCLFFDVNVIATFITQAFLMTFIIMNLACFLLEISAAPNFRPSFTFFDRYTALSGGLGCIGAMFIVDGSSATAVMLSLFLLFVMIHYYCPPKPWGDVSQNLIYHQVRKYLLRLKQDNVKYWRPQVLLLVDNPRTSWNLIQFCNHLKKGGLYVLGHVIVTSDNISPTSVEEMKKQQRAWMKLRDMSKIKAFIQVGLGPTLPWGVRNVFLGSGLGGMKPNITVLGFYDRHLKNPKSVVVDMENLPTDECRNEKKIGVQEWVQILEDLSLMQSNIAVASGFGKMCAIHTKKYIDLYPIQMSARVVDIRGVESMLTTNFDTYTLILQLGAILHTVPDWKKHHVLRVVAFVEYDHEIVNEYKRIKALLDVLRIDAEVVVIPLSQFSTFNIFVKGHPTNERVESVMANDEWWRNVCESRNSKVLTRRKSLGPASALQIDLDHTKRYNVNKLQRMGVTFSMSVSKHTHDIDDTSSFYDDDTISRASSSPFVKSKPIRPVFSSVNLPKMRVIEEASGSDPSLIPIAERATTQCTELSFNDLPGKAQHLIMNDLMSHISGDSQVIFATLPVPQLDTHLSQESCIEYIEDMEIWLDDLPPVLLINSQTTTVTTAL